MVNTQMKARKRVASRNGFNASIAVNDIIRSFSQAFCFRIDDYSLIIFHNSFHCDVCVVCSHAIEVRNAMMLFLYAS